MSFAESRARVSVGLTLALAALSACGRSRRSEDAGAAGAGGERGGAGGSSAGAAGTSKAEACIAYTTAVCKRRAECLGVDAGDCFSATQYCPDATFGAGSTLTVASLLACAGAYATFPCAALARDQVPPCATAGTLPAGARCEFSAQCASLTCVGSPCGSCAEAVRGGEPCVSEGVVCASGFYCGGDGRCAALPDPSRPPALGDACASSVVCPDQAFCSLPPGSGTGTCAPYPGAGEACAESLTCRAGSYCDLDQTCRALPGEGAACGVDAFTGRATWCASGLVCEPGASLSEGTCSAPRAAGEPCVTTTGAVLAASCAKGLYCDTAQTPATCTAPQRGGESCAVEAGSLACELGYQCRCGDDACSTRSCVAVGSAGDACGGSSSVCHPAFECTDGVCAPRDSQDYAGRCPG
jgi:hypothetical protein